MEFVTLRSPLDMLEASPALLAAEIITYGTFLLCAWHAWRNGAEHCLLLFVTLTAASAVDPFCLISPQIRNYYHDHASVLLADRRVAPWQFPLFADLAYLGAAAVWRLNLPLEVELAAVAVVNSYTFYPADQCTQEERGWVVCGVRGVVCTVMVWCSDVFLRLVVQS